MSAKSISEILEIRQEQYTEERNLRKIILSDTFNLEGKFSYEEMLNMTRMERNILLEIVNEQIAKKSR